MGFGVQNQIGATQRACRRVRPGLFEAEPDPDHQLGHGERLHLVVGPAGGQPAHPVLGRIPGGQEDDGGGGAAITEPLQHGEPVHVRQHDVEHHDVGAEGADQLERLRSGLGDGRLEPVELER